MKLCAILNDVAVVVQTKPVFKPSMKHDKVYMSRNGTKYANVVINIQKLI